MQLSIINNFSKSERERDWKKLQHEARLADERLPCHPNIPLPSLKPHW